MGSFFKTFFIVLVTFIYSASAAEQKLNVAIFPITSKILDDGERSALTDALRSEIGKNSNYQVMERSQMSEILKEQGFQQSGACNETSCLVEMGQLLGANYIVIGNIGQVGKTYSVNGRLVDVATSKIMKDVTTSHKGSKDEILTDVIPGLAKELDVKKGDKKVSENKKKGPIIGTVVGLAVVAAAVPAIILLTRDDDSNEETPNTIEW